VRDIDTRLRRLERLHPNPPEWRGADGKKLARLVFPGMEEEGYRAATREECEAAGLTFIPDWDDRYEPTPDNHSPGWIPPQDTPDVSLV
jgi:hypothetical protein